MTDYNERSLFGRLASSNRSWDDLDIHEKFDQLDIYYSNNSLYDAASTWARDSDEWLEAIKPLRNPTHRSIEFFASKLAMGKPKILVANKSQAVADAIEQVHKWSAFATNKRPMLRKDALYGNLFIKTVFDGKRIVETALDTRNVTDFEADERGFLLWIRIDVPLDDRKTYTEYWTKQEGFNGYVATWTHVHGRDMKLESMGDADTFNWLSDFGIDFIPIIHTKFIDTGEKWGIPRTGHAIEKINEVDRKMTNLSEMVFQSDMYLILRNGMDAKGIARPVGDLQKPTDAEIAKFGHLRVLKAQGIDEVRMSAMNFAWGEFLAIVKSDEEELQLDLPELRYFTLRENELSGIAMRTLLAGALDVATEAEEAFVTGQQRANEIALTMGQFYGLFNGLGTFEDGDFEHALQFEEIIPVSTNKEKIDALASMANIRIPIQVKMKLAGFAQEEIDQVPEETPEPAPQPVGFQ